MKKPKPKKPSPTAIAKAAGCSKALASRLLARGLSEEQIIERLEERRARELARLASAETASGAVNGRALLDLPVVPLPEEATFPPFAESERRKEFFLSRIRQLQAQKLDAQLFTLEPLRAIVFAPTHYLINRLSGLPDEMIDELTPEAVKFLRIKLAAAVEESRRVMAWECQRCGISPPPEPPPETRQRLAYYERFIRDSRRGEIEVIPLNERIDSEAWRAAHPSITFEQGFRILALKRQWDEDMLALLRRRAAWDLPSEVPDPPPPEPEAA